MVRRAGSFRFENSREVGNTPSIATLRVSLALAAPLLIVGCAMDLQPVDSHQSSLRDLDSIENDFLVLLNQHREENGAPPVRSDRYLNDGAYDYAGVMGRAGHFDHTGPDGSSPWDRMCDASYEPACGPSTAVGENIAAGQQSGADVFRAWRNSPGHNRNMLDPSFRVVGIGRNEVPGSEYRVYWVNTFGGQPTDQTVDTDVPEPPRMDDTTPEPEEPPVTEPGGTPDSSGEPMGPPGSDGGTTMLDPLDSYALEGGCSVAPSSTPGLNDPEPWVSFAMLGLLWMRRRR